MLLLHMLEYPELQRRLVEDPTLVDKAVDESLRLGSPIQRIARTVERDVCLNGVDLAEGDKVVLAWGSANRDEVRFENADTFVVDRPNNGHLGFGDGIHRCPGASLARVEMRVVLEEVLRRIPDYRLADRESAEVPGILARRVTRLPVVW